MKNSLTNCEKCHKKKGAEIDYKIIKMYLCNKCQQEFEKWLLKIIEIWREIVENKK